MKIFLIIFLASGLASSEKLDRSYLPPPGSKFSGGTPGDIETPLEFPKQPTGPQLPNGKPEIELGIDRRPAASGLPDKQKPGFTYFQNSYPVPKTTTSYAITQTTTFAPADNEGIDQPNVFLNGTNQNGPGQNFQQPIRGPGRRPGYNQYRPGPGQTSVAPYGTSARPQSPGIYNGPEYLPPVSSKRPGQDGSGYPSGLPQGTKYQDGQVSANRPGYVPPGFNQQNQYAGIQTPSTQAPQYQDGRFVPTGPGSQQSQNQFPASQFPPSTAAPQFQAGQKLTTPGNQENQYSGNQFPPSTTAPQYQAGKRLNVPSGTQDFPSSTAAPQYEFGQRFTTPGQNQQQYGTRVPNQQNQFTGSQYQGNQNFPTSTAGPTPGSIEGQFSENQNFPSTAAPNYQDGQRFTTPDQIQGGLIPGQQAFGSRVPSQNQFVGQNFPTSTTAPQYQDGLRVPTPGYIQEGYGPVINQQNQNQYPANQNYPSSTNVPQYQNGQQFTTPGSANQNFPSTVAPNYQGGQRFTTPGQYQGQYVPGQQIIGSLTPGQQSQTTGSQIYPSSSPAPQDQDGQRFSTPGARDRFELPQLNQQNQYPGNQNFPTSTKAPQFQYDQQRFTSPGSEQTFGLQQQNQFGNQNFPTSTVSPQYQDQRITTPGQLFNQPTYPESTPTPGSNLSGAIPYQQNQYKQPTFNQQYPSSTVVPQGFVPGSQPQLGTNIIPTPGTEVVVPESQGGPGSQIYENTQQPTSQTEASSSVSGSPSVPPRFPNQGLPSTTAGLQPAGDFGSTPGFGTIGGIRQERPQAEGDRNAEILSYENVLTPEGYFYSYDTSNGIHADETGTVGDGTRAQGGYSYIGDDGKVYSVVYSADENGFQPRGDHLPTPPPIPEAIQRVIEQANKDKDSGIDDDGFYNEEKYGYMKYEGPLSRMRPQNRTVSLVNGAVIPDVTESSVGVQIKKTLKAKGNKPGSKAKDDKESESDLEDTDIFESETDEIEEDRRDYADLDKNLEPNRRISSKRPKPIKNITVKDNKTDRFKETKLPMKPLANSKTSSAVNKTFDRNSTDRRPILSTEDEESAVDGISEEPEDNDDLQESQGADYDSDLVNYRDDPNNRTDFRGLNKYLPESKQTNRKKQLAKKRPMVRVKGTKQPVGVDEAETTEDRNNQVPQGDRLGYDGEKRISIPSRKYNIGQKTKSMSKTTGQGMPRDSDDEVSQFGDDVADLDDEYEPADATKTVTRDRVSKPGTSQSKKIVPGKGTRPTIKEQTSTSDNQEIIPSSGQETGYKYTLPQRKFEDSSEFPSRTSTQKGSQTTLRPFMTKNVYGDENEPAEDYNGQFGGVKPGRPGRPMIGQKQYPGYNENADGNNQNPETNQDERFSTTRRPVSYGTSRRPFGTQSTGIPQYQNQGVTGQVYNEPTIQTQRPGDTVYYNTNAPSRETSGNIFSSSTPLPPSGQDSSRYQRPGYNRPSIGSNFETTSPGEEYINGAYKPSGPPSTTYRPNYSFGEKISSPVTVDGFGRPIQSTNAPTFDRTLQPTYSTARPSEGVNRPSAVDQFSPTEGRFSVTSTQGPPGYQSTSAPIGEDFSGPQQPQRYDSETGYHYK